MTDYNSMKADEYAQRLGDEQLLSIDIENMSDRVFAEIPKWMIHLYDDTVEFAVYEEAKRRVMLAIKERSEP